jgi:hypothetical protein
MNWRKSWARNWERMRYCSKRCRSRRGHTRLDRELERAIEELLATPRSSTTICPSEAARLVRPRTWQGIMELARDAARRMCVRGDIEILQGGRLVDPSTARGPIRLRWVAR